MHFDARQFSFIAIGGLAVVALLMLLQQKRRQRRRQREAELDSVLEDSFPASDPPSYGTIVASGGPKYFGK